MKNPGFNGLVFISCVEGVYNSVIYGGGVILIDGISIKSNYFYALSLLTDMRRLSDSLHIKNLFIIFPDILLLNLVKQLKGV